MYRSRPVSLAPVGLFLWVTGCATYTQIELSDISNHDVVRVTTTTGERRTYSLPRLENERVVGQNERSTPVAQVAALEAVGTDEVALGEHHGLREPLPQGALLSAWVKLDGEPEAFPLTVDVVWCRPASAGQWLVGLRILESDDTAYLEWVEAVARAMSEG